MKRALVPLALLLLASPAARGANDAAWVRLKDPLDTATVKAGEAIFANRTYAFESFPKELGGLSFVRGDIEATFRIEVVRDGILRALTAAPEARAAHGQSGTLTKQGFSEAPDGVRYQLFGTSVADRVCLYRKPVKTGETYTFHRWTVVAAGRIEESPFKAVVAQFARDEATGRHVRENLLTLQPDYVVFVPRQRREIVGDRYNDHFQVFDKPDGTLFAAWTQATKEGDVDQHVCFSRSRDKGRTWTGPVILAGSPNHVNPQPIASWQQPMVSKSGRIYMLWNQRVSNDPLHHGIMAGKYSDDDGDTWSQPRVVPFPRVNRDPPDKPPSWCIWQRPLRLGKDGRYLAGLTRHGVVAGETATAAAVESERENKDNRLQSKLAGSTVEFIQYDNIDDDPKIEDIRVVLLAANEKEVAVIDPKWGLCCQEASIVALPDGRLFALMRTSAGSPYWTQSRDKGLNWDSPKVLKDAQGKAYLHPCAPCPIYDRKGPEAGSGEYFAFVSNEERNEKNAYAPRGPLFLIAGTFDPQGEQPIRFAVPKPFPSRPAGNAFYTSLTVVEGRTVLWIPDWKHFLIGKVIGDEWFE
ncbi:MAG: glycoside hydrolase [Verrucomicrobia bacterium]|nr:glycoside hydrolase [Verrucomicrobiota bacterium]